MRDVLTMVPRVITLLLLVHLSIVHGAFQHTGSDYSDCPEHVCNDGKYCYSHAEQCDGKQDCNDKTDEDPGHCGNIFGIIIQAPKLLSLHFMGNLNKISILICRQINAYF